MAMTPNRIQLIQRGRLDEAVTGAACYPGMSCVLNSSGLLVPDPAVGQSSGPLCVPVEDALRGGDARTVLPSGYRAPFTRAAKGDELLMILATGQNVARGAGLMNKGDGALIAWAGGALSKIVAPSTVVTNVGTETTFSNGTFTFPVNSLKAGDVVHIRARATCVAENSTNTHRVRVYVGATALADSGARALAAADYVIADIYLTVRTVGASGTFVADGVVYYTISATATAAPFIVASTTIDTTATEAITVTTLASATSAGNQIRLDEFLVEVNSGGGAPVAFAYEAIDNSSNAGSDPMSGLTNGAFIRVTIP